MTLASCAQYTRLAHPRPALQVTAASEKGDCLQVELLKK